MPIRMLISVFEIAIIPMLLDAIFFWQILFETSTATIQKKVDRKMNTSIKVTGIEH